MSRFLWFTVYICGAHWRHLKNTTEPSMCGGDAALCQITLTTCYNHPLELCRFYQSYDVSCSPFVTAQFLECSVCAIAEVGGTDYVPVVSCLVQLALDPHCRTLRGFENLVEREWVVLGHQFVERCALAAIKDAEMVICLSVSAEVNKLKQQVKCPLRAPGP